MDFVGLLAKRMAIVTLVSSSHFYAWQLATRASLP
jgi:hypothetical protein